MKPMSGWTQRKVCPMIPLKPWPSFAAAPLPPEMNEVFMRTIQVNLPSDSYSIIIEPGLLTRLGRAALDVAPSSRALLAVDSKIAATHGAAARDSLEASGYQVIIHSLKAE